MSGGGDSATPHSIGGRGRRHANSVRLAGRRSPWCVIGVFPSPGSRGESRHSAQAGSIIHLFWPVCRV